MRLFIENDFRNSARTQNRSELFVSVIRYLVHGISKSVDSLCSVILQLKTDLRCICCHFMVFYMYEKKSLEHHLFGRNETIKVKISPIK